MQVDVSQNPAEQTKGVAQFWREFTVEHETEERVVNDEPGFGIGVYRAPVIQNCDASRT